MINLTVATNDAEGLRCKQKFSYYESTLSGAYIMALENEEVIVS